MPTRTKVRRPTEKMLKLIDDLYFHLFNSENLLQKSLLSLSLLRMNSDSAESSDASETCSKSSISKTTVYNLKFFFRGRQIAEECEPPTDLIDDFLDFIANGIIHLGWDQSNEIEIEHSYCSDNCAIETCLVFGWPYSISVRESLKA